jgi:hypothetical protein
MLREAGGGPERPDFAGDLRGRGGSAGLRSRFRLDSLNGDDADDVAKLLDASAWRRVHCDGGASSTMAAVVVSFVSGSNTCREGRPRREGGVAALGREKQGRLGFARRRLGGDLVEGKRITRLACSVLEGVTLKACLVGADIKWSRVPLRWRQTKGKVAWGGNRIGFPKNCKNRKRGSKERRKR